MSRRESVAKAKLRTRRDSGTKLDLYYKIVNKTILSHQVCPFYLFKFIGIFSKQIYHNVIKNPVTGLLAASSETDHSWVRDDVYSIMAVWALALAYKKVFFLNNTLSGVDEGILGVRVFFNLESYTLFTKKRNTCIKKSSKHFL